MHRPKASRDLPAHLAGVALSLQLVVLEGLTGDFLGDDYWGTSLRSP